MDAQRPSPAEVAVAGFAAAASFFTLVSWRGLSADASAFLGPLFWMALGVATVGLVLRAARLPVAFVPVGQVLAVALVLHRMWATDALFGGWVPTPTSVAAVLELVRASAESTGQYAAPVPADVAVFPPVMILTGAVVILAVDALAATARRAPLSGLPLLAAFTAPVTLLDGVPWLVFAVAAAAFVMLLAADHTARLGDWGHNLSGAQRETGRDGVRDSWPQHVRLGTVWPPAARLGLAGIALGVLVPLVLPAGDGLLGGASGPGFGRGEGVRLENPFVDIRRDLVRGEDLDLVEVRTDDPDPRYLRLTVLDEYDGERWSPSERSIPATNDADGELPPVPGLGRQTPRTTHTWWLRVTDDFATTWLPLPYPATAVDVAGDWRYDSATLDVVNADGEDAAGLAYAAVGVELEPDPQALVNSGLPPRGLLFDNTSLPDSVPPWVRELAEQVTEGATGDFQQAVLLQRWFREDGGFRYSLDRAPGNGVDDLERFLGTGDEARIGYCEQFAASMALMARSLGVPARVAVGFLRPSPSRLGDGSVVFSSHDLHAWPEIYIDGAGWMRFEPTPPIRTEDAPAYTTADLPETPAVPEPSADATTGAPDSAGEDRSTAGDGVVASGADAGRSPWLWGLAACVIAVLAAAGPRAARSWLRHRRLRPSAADALAEGVWGEVRATAVDLGVRWEDGATLRRRAADLRPALGGDQGASAALDRLVLVLERSRYSRAGLAGGTVDGAGGGTGGGTTLRIGEDGRAITTALRAAAGTRARRKADWVCPSLWRGTSAEARRQRGDGGEPLEKGRSDRVSV